MNISYDSYRVFYYAAKFRSFSQAAAALYSNQPNVTRMIRKLESELGCALFFRSPQGVRLTPEGEKLYTHIAVAFESIEAGEEEVLSDQSLQSGIVHIAASSLALRTRLLQVLARYRRAYPHVRICLTNHSASHGLAAVQNGLADFAILAEGASVPDSLTAQKIDEIQEIPICGPAFLELTEEPVSLKRLADYPIISLTEGTSSHDFYAELFLRHGLSFSPDVEVETTAQVPPVVQSDLGVGFVPREMLYGTPEASGIYPIMLEEPIPARSVFLFQRKTQPLSIAAKKLRQMLLEDAPQESGNYHMGTTAENICDVWGITREELDAFGAASQQKTEAAQKAGRFDDEIVPVPVKVKKEIVEFKKDEFPRAGSTVEGLAKLRGAFPVGPEGVEDEIVHTFEPTGIHEADTKKHVQRVTAGNASGINDGAAAIVLASGEAVKKYNLKPMAKLVSWGQGGVDPKIMGVGPVPASRQAMQKAGLTIDDIDLVEANEAFAAQSIAVARELHFDMSKVNVNGGAISIGHPVGASGARIIVTLLHEMLKRDDAKKGLATLCIGGGQGVATIFEKC